uniref:Uncharacterized protein n=1 Tax=Opuntia streptacantha TaxID=393608 RepID=A0A7C9AB86_OPUST
MIETQEVPLKEFYEALAKHPQLENMVLEELLKQTEKLKLCAALLKKPAEGAALLKKPAEENKEEFEFPYDFLKAAAPVAGWGLTNVMSESTVKMFQDFPHKWVHSAAALAVDLGIFAIVGAWVMQKKSPFFSKCLWGTGLTFMFAGALFCQAPLLVQLL